MFLRKKFADKDVVINTDLIWKVEVSRSMPEGGREWSVSRSIGDSDAGTTKWYTVFIDNEKFLVRAMSGRLAEIAEIMCRDAEEV
jgi:hypothetical protein